REKWEHEQGHVGSLRIPLQELWERMDELRQLAAPIVVYCQSESRSIQALALMKEAGISQARSLAGGWQAWQKAQKQKGKP
ncbi:MAG: rhodanese-like domain-containing protein, partial [Cytophagales bacterium]|nr:rhodanese-like domain-containing protein [Cytophagales bacterium]